MMTTYGIPFYGASWVPLTALRSTVSGDEDTSTTTSPEYLVLAGGGGEGNNGIPNLLLLTQFDFSTNSLSSDPVVRLETADEVPYRIAVHPRGEGLICSFPKSCRWFDWDTNKSNEDAKLGLKSSDKVLSKLEDVGQQLAMTFSEDGSLLAVGGEDGKLRVFKWPSLEVLFSEEQTYTAVKDLHFSIDGKYLVSIGSGGPCKVWDVTTSKDVASLSKQKDEIFGFCRFAQSVEGDQILYTVDKGGCIISWNTQSWNRISSKRISPDIVTAFNVSADGKLLAIGTAEGNVLIVDSFKLQVRSFVKKAHLVVVTALTFTHDSRALASVSMDSRVRVTLVPEKSAKGFNYWIIIMFVILAIAMYFLKRPVLEYLEDIRHN